MAGAGAWCLPALYYPVPFPSLIGHKASSALVYLHLSPQDFPGAPRALQSSAVIAEGSGSVTCVTGHSTDCWESKQHGSIQERGRCPEKGSLSAEDGVWAWWGERRALHEGVQVGAAKEVTSPWVEMWHQPSFTLTAIKQSTGAQNPQRHLISTLVLSPFYCPLI